VKQSGTTRRVAYNVLQAVHEKDAYSNLVLPGALDDLGVSARDAGLATEITYGTLRRQGTLDAVIDACASRTDSMDSSVRDVLRVGAYQLLFMRIPSHAAVDETVTLAREVAGMGASKFVNAVLRKISAKTWDEWLAELSEGKTPVEVLALEYSYPVWVIRSLADAYKCDLTSIREILAAGNEPAPVSLVAKPGQATVEELLDLPHVSPGVWSPLAATMLRPSGPDEKWSTRPGDIEAVRDNRIGVQDEGSQLVALALANVEIQGPQSHWLDMCAGPGGKAAILAGLANAAGADFTALEPIAARAHLVSNSLWNAPGDPKVLVIDAREYESDVEYDRILVDAPCTGLGALRRRPEARWRRQPSDVPPLTALQQELLTKASELVRVGGVVGYVTCSPHLAETDSIVANFLKRNPNFEALDVSPVLPQLKLPTGSLSLRLRPDVHHTDGMFLALLRRTA
jgi:16S rRNA (cytosine967-C5)-methyltransferase